MDPRFMPTPPLLEDRLREIENDKKTHRVTSLDGDYAGFKRWFEIACLCTYISQCALNLIVTIYWYRKGGQFRSLADVSITIFVVQYAMNVFMFYASFGVRPNWAYERCHSVTNMWDFYFGYEWSGYTDWSSVCKSIFVGCLLGPLSPIFYYFHWANPETTGCYVGCLQRWVNNFIHKYGFADKRDAWRVSDLGFRQTASDTQLFLNFVNPSIFVIFLNQIIGIAPQFFLHLIAVLRQSDGGIDWLLVVSFFLTLFAGILSTIFISSTAYWKWYLFTFFAINFDIIMFFLYSPLTSAYRAKYYYGYVYRVCFYGSVVSSIFIPYRIAKTFFGLFNGYQHVGPKYPRLQFAWASFATTLFSIVYAGIAIFRSFSWMVELEFALNRRHFYPRGLFAKLFGWCMLPMEDKSYTASNTSGVDDYALRVVIANLVLGAAVYNEEEDEQTTEVLTKFGRRVLNNVAEAKSLDGGDLGYQITHVQPRADNVVWKCVNPIRATKESFFHSCRMYKESSWDSDVGKACAEKCFVWSTVSVYCLLRSLNFIYIGWTIGVILRTSLFDGMVMTTREVVAVGLVAIELVNIGICAYLGYHSFRLLRTSASVLWYIPTIQIPTAHVKSVFASVMELYDRVVRENTMTQLLVEKLGEDVGREVRSFLQTSPEIDETLLKG